MTDSSNDSVMALVTVPPSLEELIIDLLLGHEVTSAFTSVTAHGHGADHDRLSLAEQVSGRRKQIQFQVEIPVSAAPALMTAIREAIPGGDFHCCFLKTLTVRI